MWGIHFTFLSIFLMGYFGMCYGQEDVHMALAPREETIILTSGTIFRDCRNCPEMVVIPGGTFLMGDTHEEEISNVVPKRHRGRAQPQKRVVIEEAFAVGVTEVTRLDFSRFVYDTQRVIEECWTFSAEGWRKNSELSWEFSGIVQSRLDPVVCISWEDAQAYTEWLSEYTQQSYRLLSEEEWEYVARGGTSSVRFWGNQLGRNLANCQICGSIWDNLRTAPIKSFLSNEYSVYEILGNVGEWVSSCWTDDYRTEYRHCQLRVIRGGSWVSPAYEVRSAYRDRGTPTLRTNFIGFRLARDL